MKQNGSAGQPTVNVSATQAAAYALQFLEGVSHTRAQRDAYDMAVGLLQAIATGQVVIAPPPSAMPVAEPAKADER